MKKHLIPLIGGTALFFSLMSVACANSILQFFATPTLTTTYTPPVTSTFTATPPPPVQIIPCPFEGYAADVCYEAKTPRWFLPKGQELYAGIEYPVEFSYSEPIYFTFSWCALTREILDENLASIVFVFSIDDYSYLGALAHGYYTREYDQSSSGEEYCYGIAGVLQGWKMYNNHIVRIGLEITDPIFDGWNKYEPNRTVLVYHLKPIQPTPTAAFTCTPTRTRTPTPTRTRTPVPVYYTATPSCSETVPLYIKNDTGGYISLTLNGVNKYSFWLGPGYHTLQVCPGSYSFTASGCGGSTTSGTTNAGDEHTFFCTSSP